MSSREKLISLPIQMLLAFVSMVLLTSLAIGIPAIILMQDQLEQQAWTQVEQGEFSVLANLRAELNALENLAILTAQRPTLHSLMEQEDFSGLNQYLAALQEGTDADSISVCQGSKTISTTHPNFSGCSIQNLSEYYFQETDPNTAWIISKIPIDSNVAYTHIVVGEILDDGFSTRLRNQTGFEQILCWNQESISSSLKNAFMPIEPSICSADGKESFTLTGIDTGDSLFYSSYINLNDDGLGSIIALDVTNILVARSNLIKWLSISIMGISLIASVSGVFIARRISRPLIQLAQSAEKIQLGDLETPVSTSARVIEVARVAQSLEKARSDLLESLTSLKKERDWSEQLIESIVEGIITLDADERIFFFSQGAERITGWQAEEVTGKHIDQVFCLQASDTPFSNLLPFSAGQLHKIDVIIANDQTASLAITGALIKHPDASIETALVLRDISDEEAIHRMLGLFLANVAHEFRTPLAAVEASIELLLEQAPELNQQELAELHTSLYLGIISLHTLVDNLLESANLEARRFRISARAVNIQEMISEASRIMQPLLHKYEQHLSFELPLDLPEVQADPRRIVQVLINLLSNASRYGPVGGRVEIKVSKEEEAIRIEVIDQGPGIPEEQRSSLFRRFVIPVADDTISTRGAGLGLSVVKAIVSAHNGNIGVICPSTGGSIFWFTLPFTKDVI